MAARDNLARLPSLSRSTPNKDARLRILIGGSDWLMPVRITGYILVLESHEKIGKIFPNICHTHMRGPAHFRYQGRVALHAFELKNRLQQASTHMRVMCDIFSGSHA